MATPGPIIEFASDTKLHRLTRRARFGLLGSTVLLFGSIALFAAGLDRLVVGGLVVLALILDVFAAFCSRAVRRHCDAQISRLTEVSMHEIATLAATSAVNEVFDALRRTEPPLTSAQWIFLRSELEGWMIRTDERLDA